ncbi:uncharacterized protein LOC122265621 [Penaeus japonicus]|uniref:uncharacterized protein LOC122265621 n=1 Tax=Penaeus japonicus TaxID=27405 RepID=UPI001C7122FC|nr:uncharacterized protein LOC122265621 [Penaeus japonicus]
MACCKSVMFLLWLGLWNGCCCLQTGANNGFSPRRFEVRTVHSADGDSYWSDVHMRSLSSESPAATATDVTLKTFLPSCRHLAAASFTHRSVNASVTWACGDLTAPTPGHFHAQVNTRGKGEGLRLIIDSSQKNVTVTSSGVELTFKGGPVILDDLQESTTWRLWAQNRKHTNQACTRPREEGPPQRDSYIPGETAAGVDLQCTPTFTEPNEIYQGRDVDETDTRQPEHFGVEFKAQVSKGKISVTCRSLLGERRLLTYASTEVSGAGKWMLHLPTLNLRLNASSTSWREYLKDHSYFEAEMTNLITKTSIRITSKEVLVRQRDNVDAREKQVQEEKTASETVHSHPSKGMETGSEEDLSGNSSSRSDNERGLDEDLVGGDFQDTEGSSGGFDFIPTVLPANCIPGSKRVKQVQQSVSSSIFNMETNMTIDATPTGEHIIGILQKASLPDCPNLGWALRQIFNFSSSFAGWENVVSQWSWGSMVVEAQWGVSFFQYYHKIFAFNTDQNSPLPSTHIILDFRDYKEFQVKAKCPTLGKSLVFNLHTDADHHTFMVRSVNEFMPRDSVIFITVDVVAINDDLAVTWYFDEEKTLFVWNKIAGTVIEALSSTRFCGQNSVNEKIEKFIMDIFDATSIHLMPEVWSLVNLMSEVEELKDLSMLLKEMNQDVFEFSSHWSNLLAFGYKVGILEAHPQGVGVTVKTKGIIQMFYIAMESVKPFLGCSSTCDTTHQLSRLIENFIASIHHS